MNTLTEEPKTDMDSGWRRVVGRVKSPFGRRDRVWTLGGFVLIVLAASLGVDFNNAHFPEAQVTTTVDLDKVFTMLLSAFFIAVNPGKADANGSQKKDGVQ